jgi:hypothetical protein
MVKNFISAADAKKRSDASEKPLNVLFKHIQEAVEWGLYQIIFDVEGWPDTRIIETVKVLNNAGYIVTEITKENGEIYGLKIHW